MAKLEDVEYLIGFLYVMGMDEPEIQQILLADGHKLGLRHIRELSARFFKQFPPGLRPYLARWVLTLSSEYVETAYSNFIAPNGWPRPGGNHRTKMMYRHYTKRLKGTAPGQTAALVSGEIYSTVILHTGAPKHSFSPKLQQCTTEALMAHWIMLTDSINDSSLESFTCWLEQKIGINWRVLNMAQWISSFLESRNPWIINAIKSTVMVDVLYFIHWVLRRNPLKLAFRPERVIPADTASVVKPQKVVKRVVVKTVRSEMTPETEPGPVYVPEPSTEVEPKLIYRQGNMDISILTPLFTGIPEVISILRLSA